MFFKTQFDINNVVIITNAAFFTKPQESKVAASPSVTETQTT